ncbi:MAG: hypothetical protein ABJH72_21405 [Reichenbachiella sp.]|uniref:hypothetical protein n=1 Tax=Reichenbachiella sp. TaxID=2184521 RepID=UPI00326363B2
MEWYLPFTVIPGVGLIILSTSNIMLNLNDEIFRIKNQANVAKEDIIELKLSQLKILSHAIVLQYIGLFLFLVSGMVNALFGNPAGSSKWSLLIGVGFIGISIILLITYSYRAIAVRQKHLQL